MFNIIQAVVLDTTFFRGNPVRVTGIRGTGVGGNLLIRCFVESTFSGKILFVERYYLWKEYFRGKSIFVERVFSLKYNLSKILVYLARKLMNFYYHNFVK